MSHTRPAATPAIVSLRTRTLLGSFDIRRWMPAVSILALALVVAHHPHRALAHIGGKAGLFVSSWLHPRKVEPPKNPERFR